MARWFAGSHLAGPVEWQKGSGAADRQE